MKIDKRFFNDCEYTFPLLAAGGGFIYNYRYDQLNRISSMDAWAADGSFAPTGSAALSDYAERYTYNPDGGIVTLQ
ncbi:hypothetical protein, partial [Parafilimonas sp.]|uniref:hypothetical protein n=1 Tax=Parafilimonas sp. TaxID=1969739 RepID=UPI0039E21EBB